MIAPGRLFTAAFTCCVVLSTGFAPAPESHVFQAASDAGSGEKTLMGRDLAHENAGAKIWNGGSTGLHRTAGDAEMMGGHSPRWRTSPAMLRWVNDAGSIDREAMAFRF